MNYAGSISTYTLIITIGIYTFNKLFADELRTVVVCFTTSVEYMVLSR